MNDYLGEDLASHVSEIYSPPRVTGLAKGLGLVPGMVLDLTVNDPDDDMPWDFNVERKRNKALKLMFTRRSLLLIGRPMCSSFSRLQNLNWGRMLPSEVTKVKEYGENHIKLALKMYNLQHEMGLYYLHEHPASATSWRREDVQELIKKTGGHKVVSDMCVCLGWYRRMSGAQPWSRNQRHS